MRIATIDIGANSIVFLVADGGARDLRAIHDEAEIVRLGEGIDRTGRLQQAAIERALAVLERFVRRAAELGAEHIAAVGTQALRGAHNGEAFLDRARSLLGEDVEILDGEREAMLSWRAATSSFERPPGTLRTVIDIGGGSTKLLVGAAKPVQVVSLPIGAMRLTERLLRHDPPDEDERRLLAERVDRAFDEAPAPEGELIAIGGTATTLCAISLGLRTWQGASVHGTRLRREQMEEVLERLGRLPLVEREKLPGLDPRRADVIFAGGTILSRILARAGAAEVIVSDRGIRWGLAEDLLGYGIS